MGERVGEFGTVTDKSLNRAISSHTQAQPPAPGPRLAGRQKNWLAASVWMDERNLWAVEMKHMQSDGYKLFGWWERDASRGKVRVREREVRLAREESGRKQHEKKRRVKKKQHWKEPWGGVTSTDLFHCVFHCVHKRSKILSWGLLEQPPVFFVVTHLITHVTKPGQCACVITEFVAVVYFVSVACCC